MSIRSSQVEDLTQDTELNQESRNRVVKILSRILADEYVLGTKTCKYYWNVVGPGFYALHGLFGDQYQELRRVADQVAEHIRIHGRPAIGTLQEFSDYTHLHELPGDYPSADEMLADLMADHETMARNLQKDIQTNMERYHDRGTAELLASLLQQHQQMAWMLRSSLPDAEL